MKIICGTDFSTHASEAANAAAALTTRLQGTLSLVHVMDTNRYEAPSKELMGDLCDSRQAKLKKEAARLRRQGATVEEQFLHGSPAISLHVAKATDRSGTKEQGHEAKPSARNDWLSAQLQALIPSESEVGGINSKVEVVVHSDVATAICQAAERFGADLICTGSHGRSGLSKAILGSVAQDVMARSPWRVLVIRPFATGK